MTSKAALFALLALWGIGSAVALPAYAEDAAASEDSTQDSSPLKRGIANRVWVKDDSGELPGVIRIFLSDGTLVSDSCWETHRLSPWQMTGDTTLSWNEDGMDIPAEILSVTSSELVLKLNLVSGAVEEHYRAADVPYVCPDMPRG